MADQDESSSYLWRLVNQTLTHSPTVWIFPLTSMFSFKQQQVARDKAGRRYLTLPVFVVLAITADWIRASPSDPPLAAGYGPSADNVTSSENKLILLPDRVTVICHGK